MARINWGNAFRSYESGVSHGVLYFGDEAIPWDGLVSVSRKSDLADASPRYFDGRIFTLDQEIDDYSATVEALVYPYFLEDAVLAMCDARTVVNSVADDTPFGFTYRTQDNDGYKIHIIYGITATIESIVSRTIDDAMSLDPFVFTFHTTPVDVPEARPSSYLFVDTKDAPPNALFQLENLLYGTETRKARLPQPPEIVSLFSNLAVTDFDLV